ncbi:MAG TPA: hypothetical protein VFD32_14380, partial [Dehalococcoidia bacterium]|nr:hypothetical protein [Dehalococcoidia bacterium]
MNARAGTLLLALYPEAWRERYGEEMRALVEDDPPGAAGLLSLLTGACRAHLRPERAWGEAVPAAGAMRLSVGALFACWILVSLAGSCFAKVTEHMDPLEHAHPLLGAGRALITAGAVLGSLAVAAGGLPLLWQAVRVAARSHDSRLGWLLAAPALAGGTLLAAAAVLTFLAPSRGSGFPAPFVIAVLVPLGLGVLACALVAALAPKAVMRRARPPERLLRAACWAGQVLVLAMALVTAGLLLYVPALWGTGAGAGLSGPFGASTRVTLCLALAAALAACSASVL